MHDVAPFHDRHGTGFMHVFRQFVGHDAGFLQTVKVKVENPEVRRLVFPADRKGRAGNFLQAAGSTDQTTGKSGLAAPQVTHEFNRFTATQIMPELPGDLLGLLGTRGSGLPGHAGTHTLHMLPQPGQRRQA